MSNSGFFPKVVNPNKVLYQMKSENEKLPFYFGGSAVPYNLQLKKQSYSGGGFVGDKPPKKLVGNHILKQDIK